MARTAGKITQWTQQKDSSIASQYVFGYDQADQLSSAVLSSSGTLANQYFYGYDPSGNRTSELLRI